MMTNAKIKSIIFALTLSLSGCAITPSLSLTNDCQIDLRHDGSHYIKPKFNTSIPTLGTYDSVGLSYHF